MRKTEPSHPYFHRKDGGSAYETAVIGKYVDYLDFKSKLGPFEHRQFRFIRSPMDANRFKFDEILVVGQLNSDQMELLNWLRFLHDPTEGWVIRKRNFIVIK